MTCADSGVSVQAVTGAVRRGGGLSVICRRGGSVGSSAAGQAAGLRQRCVEQNEADRLRLVLVRVYMLHFCMGICAHSKVAVP